MTIFDTSLPYDTPASYDPSAPPASNPPTRGDVWRYRFYQMQNGQPGFTSETHMFDLPLNGVTFGYKLNAVGQLTGNLQLSDVTVQDALAGQPSLDLLLDRTAVYVELNGDLVWGGVLQQANYDSMTKVAALVCQDWWGYFYNSRLIRWNATYTNADQLYIAADLINSAMGAPYTAGGYTPGYSGVVGGVVGVSLGATAQGALNGSFTSGVTRTQSWLASSFKSIGQAVADLGNATNGFDWTIDVAYDSGGNPTKTFNLWYPRAGRTAQTQQLFGSETVFNMSGASGQNYKWPTGQKKPANDLFAAGSGAGGAAVEAEASDPGMLQQGWPLLEDNISLTDVSDQTLLNQLAQARLNQQKYPVRLPQVQYNAGADSDQPLGSFALGDDARLIIPPDVYFPNGYDSARGNFGEVWWRVVQNDVTVKDDGKSSMLITYALPPIIGGT